MSTDISAHTVNVPFHTHSPEVRTNKRIQTQITHCEIDITRMWANAQRDGRPAEYRWRPLFNAAKFG